MIVVPDVAQVEVSVDAHAAQPAEAYAQGNMIAGQVLAALDAQEVPETDRRTTAIALGPHYKPGAHVPTGFTATHSLAVRIAGLERVPAVLDGLVSAAGEALRLGSLTLGSADTAGARARAETAALVDAHQRAQRLAEAAGATLGPVQAIPGPSAGALGTVTSSSQDRSGPELGACGRFVHGSADGPSMTPAPANTSPLNCSQLHWRGSPTHTVDYSA